MQSLGETENEMSTVCQMLEQWQNDQCEMRSTVCMVVCTELSICRRFSVVQSQHLSDPAAHPQALSTVLLTGRVWKPWCTGGMYLAASVNLSLCRWRVVRILFFESYMRIIRVFYLVCTYESNYVSRSSITRNSSSGSAVLTARAAGDIGW